MRLYLASIQQSGDVKMRNGNMKKRVGNGQEGFTLIEVMVVVVILGILAAVVVPNIMGKPEEARWNQAKSTVGTLNSALQMYKLDNGSYPSTDQGLDALVSKPSGSPEARNWQQGGYVTGGKLPKDPWNRDFQYLSPGVHGEIDVYSLGADGRPGGEGFDADIGNWNLDS